MALTSRLLFRICRSSSRIYPPLVKTPPPLLLSFKPSPPQNLLFLRRNNFCSQATTSSDVDVNVDVDIHLAPDVSSHPWPEWANFIQKLKNKGYFDSPDEPQEATQLAFSDANRLKTACLSFARERLDLLRSLSKKDIQAVVDSGCPNLLRKTVNSAKRLRAYVQLDEGDVCGACNLRGSCDRAYVIASDDEKARTVDVMRILLNHATSPLVHSEIDKPKDRENIEASARKLLSELIDLSDTTPDPSLPKPAVKTPSQKKVSPQVMNSNERYNDVEMKRGDWICSNCSFMNFARNLRCLKCKEDGPKRVNFDEIEMKKGDWTCPACDFMNFARNTKCLRCDEGRPKRQLNPGEWECPSCDFLNYRRNMVCLKCNCERPKDEAVQHEDHLWRRPKVNSNSRSSPFVDDDM